MASKSKGLNQLARELHHLIQTPPEDIQVIEDFNALNEIQAWIRGPDRTPFEGGFFKVRLIMDEEFPQKPPKGYFMTKIFHPNVSATGEICVNTLKKDWKPDLGIKHIFLTIKCLLIAPNPESALNEEAGRLLLEEYAAYANKVRLYTSLHAKSGQKEYTSLQEDRKDTAATSNPAASKENTTTAHATSATTLNTALESAPAPAPAPKSNTISTTIHTSIYTSNNENLNDTTVLKSLSNNSPKSPSATVDSNNDDGNKKRKQASDDTANVKRQQQENSSSDNVTKDTKSDSEGLIKKKTKLDKRKKSLKRF